MRTRAVALLAGVTLIVLGGCGGDGDDGKATATAEGWPSSDGGVKALLDHVPGEATEITVMDLAAAKRQLRLPADLDPADYKTDGRPGRGRFYSAAVKPLGHLLAPNPVVRAIDHGRVSTVIEAYTRRGPVLILTTPQPRAEIERGLEGAGRRRIAADAYALEREDVDHEIGALAFGEGLIVMAESLGVARAALARRAPDSRLAPARAVLDSVRGAFRVVRTGPFSADDAPCLSVIAGGARFDRRGGEDLVLKLKDRPDGNRVVLNKGAQMHDILTDDYKVRTIAIEGDVLRIKLDLRKDALDNSSAATIVHGGVRPRQVYRCENIQPAPRSGRTPRLPLPPPPPEPDRSGSKLETGVSGYIAAGSTAPNAVKVRCPQRRAKRNSKLRCTGTRRHAGRLYHYTIVVNFDARGIGSIDIDSPDDETGTVVEKR